MELGDALEDGSGEIWGDTGGGSCAKNLAMTKARKMKKTAEPAINL